MTVFGFLTLGLMNYNYVFWMRNKSRGSLLLNAMGVFLFIISQQPYAAVFVFSFLIMKVLMLIKRIKVEK